MGEYSGHATTFGGYPVVEWKQDEDILKEISAVAVAIRINWDENDLEDAWAKKFNTLLQHPQVEQIPALVVGMWGFDKSVKLVVSALVENRSRLPNLKALFVGDIVSEENEISWIRQGDLSPLWLAFPNLEHLVIRGGDGLVVGEMKLPHLKSLRIEAGGLSGEVVRNVGRSTLPELESVVLWLGESNYGATVTIKDLEGFYACHEMPKLKYLGLCDSEIQDAIAEFIATAPVVDRLDVLDLSMGILTDDGALALLTSPKVRTLKKLDLHYHFCSDAMVEKLRELEKHGVQIDVSQQQADRDWRFVAVGE
jgi:hypothetical protein